jgi:hypothetical protein
MTYLEAIVKVLIVGLVLGAGLPALFATGLVVYSKGVGGVTADGTVRSANSALKYFGIALFVLVGWIVLTAVAWITRATIIHHFGFDPFPFVQR